MNISIHRDGQQYGPYTLEQVQQYVADGTLLPATDLAWYEGMTEWEPLQLVVSRLTLTPPPTQQPAITPPAVPTVEGVPAKLTSDPHTFWIAFVLCLLLGIFGAHRFYLGKKSAWFMLVTFGACGLWWLIDIVLLLANQLTDKTKIRVVNPKPAITWPIAVVWMIVVLANGHDKSGKDASKEVARTIPSAPANQKPPEADNTANPLNQFKENIYEGTTDGYNVLDKNGQPLNFNGNLDSIPKVNVSVGFVNDKVFLHQVEYPKHWSSNEASSYEGTPVILEETAKYVKSKVDFVGISQDASGSEQQYIITFDKNGKMAAMHSTQERGEPDTELTNMFAATSGDSSSQSSGTSTNLEGSIKVDDVVGNYHETSNPNMTWTISSDGDFTTDDYTVTPIKVTGTWEIQGDSIKFTVDGRELVSFIVTHDHGMGLFGGGCTLKKD